MTGWAPFPQSAARTSLIVTRPDSVADSAFPPSDTETRTALGSLRRETSVMVPCFLIRLYVLCDQLSAFACRCVSCSCHVPCRSTATVSGSSDFEPGDV